MVSFRQRIAKFLLTVSIIMLTVPVYALTNNQKQQFIKKIDVASQVANTNILKQRHKLLTLYRSWQKNHTLDFFDKRWVEKKAKAYHVKKFIETQPKKWQALIRRVDIVPNSLAISQAIIESNWGRSRFARKGNNYFGVHSIERVVV